MLQAIKRYLPAETKVNHPRDGLFIWLRVADNITCSDLLPFASTESVSFAPGTKFYSHRSEGEAFVRLNYVTQTEDVIEEGIKRLGKAVFRLAG